MPTLTTATGVATLFYNDMDTAALADRGSTLLVGSSGVAAPVLFAATPVTLTNAGHLAMSFLDMLRGGLACVNVHTAANSAGAVRGQLIEVSVVPEPGTCALMLAGIGMMGMLARRRG